VAAATAGTALNVTVTALDNTGTVVPAYAGTVHFSSSDTHAVLPADSKLSNGAGNFSITLKTAGAQTITVADTATGSITGTQSFGVGPGTPSQLTVTAPAAVSAGISFGVSVSVVDAFGNVATGYTGTLHFTSSDAQAVLPANATLASGTGSFSVTFKTIGSQTVAATDTVAASLTSTSSSVNVVSNAATHFSVSAPGSVGTRATFDFQVTALDAANNASAGYSGTVHFTSSDAQANLPANATLTVGTSNVLAATFETAGTQSLTATDATAASVNGTSSISVTATQPPTVSSNSPPAGTVGTKYGPPSIQTYKCLHNVVWVCNPCGPGTLNPFCGPYPPCFIASPCLQRRTVFQGFPLTATAGVAPYIWSATGLPAGLTLSVTGRLSGTPTSPGTYPITVTVKDSGLPSVQTSQDFSLVINNPPPPVVNATPSSIPGVLNAPLSFTFTASGYGTLTWSASGAVPAGVAFDNNTGTLSGTPTQTGSFPISVTATDQFKQDSAPANFTIVITPHGFVATGSMSVARRFQTATLLLTGKVLIAGGEDAGSAAFASAELYDPSTGTFSATGTMTVSRVGHAATLLNSGKVLVTGGTSDASETAAASAEVYDPTTGTFTATTGNMKAARASHTATLLKDGKVLVAGGDGIFFNGVQNPNILSLISAEIFDPNTGTFTATGNMTAARESHTATLLNDGKVLVAGGSNGALGNTTPAPSEYISAELFDPSTGHFTATGNMTAARVYQTATLLNTGKVLLAGGVSTNSAFIASADLFDESSGTFTATGSMTAVRFYQDASLLIDGTVLVSGGSDASNRALATAEIYDPTAKTFATTGSMGHERVWHTSTLLPNGKVLITGGADNGSGPVATAEIYQ